MPQIPIYRPRVGLPNPVTSVPSPSISPILQGAGQVGNVLQQFGQKYKQAQFLSDKADAELEISRQTNAYFEGLRDNPVTPLPNEDIVEAKERSWKEFSDQLKTDYIGNLNNRDVKDQLSQWWDSASETQRTSVVQDAQAENIQFMGKRMVENIEELVNLGAFDDANLRIRDGSNAGLWSREGVQQLDGYVKQQRSLHEAQQLPFDESLSFTNKQTQLTTAQRNENIQILKSDEEARKLREAEAIKARDAALVKGIDNNIFSGRYPTEAEAIEAIFKQQGRVLTGDDQEDLIRDWFFWEGKRKDGLTDKPDKSDPSAILDLNTLSVSSSPTEFANALRRYRDENKLALDDYTGYSEMLFEERQAGTAVFNPVVQGVIERINNLDNKIYTDADKLALENNFVQYAEEDALGRIRPDNQNLQDIDALNQWLDNQITEKSEIKFEESIRQIYGNQGRFFRDIRTISGFEELAIEAEEGRLIGIVQPEKINKYFTDPTPETQEDLQQSLARNAYGKEYSKLNSDQRSIIDRNIDVVTFTEAGKALAVEELGMSAANMRIVMHRNGFPMYQNEDNELFTLRMESEDKRILGWYKYFGTRNGNDVFHLYQTVEEPEKKPGIIDKFIDLITPDPELEGETGTTHIIPNVGELPRTGTSEALFPFVGENQ